MLKKQKQKLFATSQSVDKTDTKVDKTAQPKKKEIKYEDTSENEKEVSKKSQLKKSESSLSNKTEVNSDLDDEMVGRIKKETETKDKDTDKECEWELPNFFDKKNFFIYGGFDPKKRKTISRIIIAYGGYNFTS